MGTTTMVHVRLDEKIKKKAATVLAGMNVSMSDVVRILLTRIAEEEAVPFNLQALAFSKLAMQQAGERGNASNQVDVELCEMVTFDENMHFPSLLNKVRQGRCYTIMQQGHAVANLVPSPSIIRTTAQAAVAAMQKISRIHGVSDATLAYWIAEGRQ